MLQRIKIPHVFIFLSAIILFYSVKTYITPSGIYSQSIEIIGNQEPTVVIPGK